MSPVQVLEVVSNLFNILGIIAAVFGVYIGVKAYRAERERDRLDREYGTFDELDDKYVEFMYRCADYPHLDLFSDPAPPNRDITEDDIRAERALYAVLISIFERAHLMFSRPGTEEIRKRQYQGWVECMRSYCLRPSFLREWRKIGHQFDSDFYRKMNRLIREERKKSADTPKHSG